MTENEHEHDQVYDKGRADRLAELLRALAARIQELDSAGQLLSGVPDLLQLMGDARTELFITKSAARTTHGDRREPPDRRGSAAEGLV